MADITLTVQDVVRTGLNLTTNKTTVVVANTYYFANDGRTKLHVNNIAVSACVATIDTPGDVDGLAIASRTVSVPASNIMEIGPFPKNWYNDGAGRVKVTFDQIVEIVPVRG